MSFYKTIINLLHQRDPQEIIYNLNASHSDKNTVKLSINSNSRGLQDVNEKQEPIRSDTGSVGYVQDQDTQEIEIIDPLTYCCDASTKNVKNSVYFCEFCYANFKSNTECELHKKICNNDNFFNDINTETTTPSPAPAIKKKHKILICEYCDLQFKREYWYKKHLEKLHKPLVIENYNISSSDSKTLADNDKTLNTNSSISIDNIIDETKTIFHKSIQSQTEILHKFTEVIQDKINHQNSLFLKQKYLFNNNIDKCQINAIKGTLEKQYADIQFQKQLLNDIFSTLKKETNEIESFITGLMKAIKKSKTFIDINLIKDNNNNNNSLNDSVENLESKENEEILTLHNINVEEINLNNSDIEIIDTYSINSNNINKEMIVTNGNNDYINNNAIDSSVGQQNNIYIESANATVNEIQNFDVTSDTDARNKENCIDSIKKDKNKTLNNTIKIIKNTKTNKKSNLKQIIKFNKPNNKKEDTVTANEQNLFSNENASIPNESDAIPNNNCFTNEKNRIRNVQLKYTQLSIDNIIYAVQQNVDKTFQCTLCKVSFKNLCSLKPHILRVHTKQKTKSCPHCKRTFATTGDLTRHIRIHTGDRPFKCKYPNCKFEFISSGDLYKHARRHINIRNNIGDNVTKDSNIV